MIYSDEELLAWWKSLTMMDQRDLIQRMVDGATSPSFANFAKSIQDQHKVKNLSAKQIGAVRKWSRR